MSCKGIKNKTTNKRHENRGGYYWEEGFQWEWEVMQKGNDEEMMKIPYIHILHIRKCSHNMKAQQTSIGMSAN